jgi:hypothetical protein
MENFYVRSFVLEHMNILEYLHDVTYFGRKFNDVHTSLMYVQAKFCPFMFVTNMFCFQNPSVNCFWLRKVVEKWELKHHVL